MNLMRRVFSLLLTLVTLCGVLAVPALAASTTAYDCLSDSCYATAYPLATSGKIIPYTSPDLNQRGTAGRPRNSAYIDAATDDLRVMDVGIQNGKTWAKISYPITGSNSRCVAYIPLSEITGNTHSVKSVATGKFLCALRKNSSTSSKYYVAKGDVIWLLAVYGDRVQLLYPVSNGRFRIAFASLADYEKYGGAGKAPSGGSPSSGSNDTAGMTDVTAYFAGRTIYLRSVQNGNYLCADGNKSGTPALCNRSKTTTWTDFTLSSLTSDGWVGFKASTNGKYLSAINSLPGAPVTATATKVQSWECFRVYMKGNDFYIKAQANGKWLTARVDLSNAPLQAQGNGPSTLERFTIRFSDQEQYISAAELISTAVANGIRPDSSAFDALMTINIKYAPQLSGSDESGTNVFMFEGVGSDNSPSRRMNAMCVVIRGGDIVYLNRNCSTIPDYPFDPSKNDGTPMPTLKSGIYSFKTVNHRNQYAALNVLNAQVVRFSNPSTYCDGNSSGINVHRRSSNSIASSSAGWVNSAGCLLVGQKGTGASDEYARFLQALGIVPYGTAGNAKYKSSVTGKIIVDRSFGGSYLHNVGYPIKAIQSLI